MYHRDLEVASIIEAAEKPVSKKAKKATSAVVTVSVIEDHTPLTLAGALEGVFAGFTPISETPEWLEAALEPDGESAKQLYGRHVAYHWDEWGWAVGRLGAASKRDSNFSVLYSKGWREQQTLTLYTPSLGRPAGRHRYNY